MIVKSQPRKHSFCKQIMANKNPLLKIQNNLNIKSGKNKKKPQDSEESRVNLMAEDEVFDLIMV